MIKKLLVSAIAFILLLLLPITNEKHTFADSGDTFTTSDGVTYRIKSNASAPLYAGGYPGYVTVVSYKPSKKTTSLIVPQLVTYNNYEYYVNEISDFAFAGSSLTSISLSYRVEKIGAGAFASCTGLKSFTVPDMCQRIGKACFYGCTSLTSFNICSGLMIIGDGCFSFCNSLSDIRIDSGNRYFAINEPFLTDDRGNTILFGYKASGKVTIPDTVKSIAPFAFEGNSQIKSIKFGSSVKSIEQGTFLSCSKLKTVDLKGITSIGQDAFCDCALIEELSIPASVTKIVGNPFGYCTGLITIKVDSSNPNYSSKNNMLLNKSGNTMICGNALKGTIVLDIGVRYIDEYAFFGNRLLTGITFTASLKDIGDYAFKGCSNLSRVRFSSRRTELTGKDIFKDTNYYVEISLPYSNSAWAANSIELAVQKLSPKGALFTNWTR